MQTTSADGTPIHYELTGSADTALVFVHGWLGNVRWWDAQRDALASAYRVVTIDLGNHGASGARAQPSAEGYANDIAAVVRAVDAPRVILVGHSMSGAWVLAAAPQVARLAGVILVDTLKNLDAMPSPEQADAMLGMYRADYANAVATMLPKFLFGARTPADVAARLTREFLAVTGDTAASLLAPLYRHDIRPSARAVEVPVRGIGTDLNAHDDAVNRGYLADYTYVDMAGYGHYPMLEAPAEFTGLLRAALATM